MGKVGLYFWKDTGYKGVDGYDDITLGCSLKPIQVDHNFKFLRGNDIVSGECIDNTLILYKVSGDKVNIQLTDSEVIDLSGTTYNGETGELTLVVNGNEYIVDGFLKDGVLDDIEALRNLIDEINCSISGLTDNIVALNDEVIAINDRITEIIESIIEKGEIPVYTGGDGITIDKDFKISADSNALITNDINDNIKSGDTIQEALEYIANNLGVTSVNGETGDVVVQETLVSGENIKTINGESVLGEGNIEIDVPVVDDELDENSPNAISNRAVTKVIHENEEVISAALNDLNERIINTNERLDLSVNEINNTILEKESATTEALNGLNERIDDTNSKVDSKQDTLVSGENIKTINGESILGEGNIEIEVPTIVVDDELDADSDNAISNKAVTNAISDNTSAINDVNARVDGKQETLVSGVNIKTINGQSILGEGNIEIEGPGGGQENVIEIVKVNGTALTPDSNKAVDVPVPTTLSSLTDDATHRLVSDDEKESWNEKQDALQHYEETEEEGVDIARISVGDNVITVDEDGIYIHNEDGSRINVDYDGVAIYGNATINDNEILTQGNVDSELDKDSNNPVSNKAVTKAIIDNERVISAALNDLDERVNEKQDILVSSENIKTINGESILGEGNIDIEGGGDVNVQSDWNVTDEESDAYIKNKPVLATVAISGSYNDLTDKPESFDGSVKNNAIYF